jgi:hypothetical protein
VSDLVIGLLGWVALLTGEPSPSALPRVERVPHAVLETLACGRPCPVLGLYAYGEVIYLDERLDPESDLFARSILVHELVHYVQERSGRYAEMDRCAAAALREREAYLVQNQYLLRHGDLPRAGSSLHQVRCAPAGGQAGSTGRAAARHER